ncbi:MAG: S41 family peptidase [Ignavibacteria bacterium]|nr:S41 family peptidase [Ignavibacteria bacterium]
MKKYFTYNTLLFIISFAVISSFSFAAKENDNKFLFKINKSIDIFGKVYQEIASNYVEGIDPERLMQAGIDGMLDVLDPYTEFYDADETDEVDLLTTGTYGGVGITIGVRDGYITILSLMEGYSAQRQGLIPGDRLIEIDGKNIVGWKVEDVRKLTRGDPFTEVKVKIERDGEKESLEFSLMREKIQLKSITFADFVEPQIAYIRLERFTRQTGEDLQDKIRELKKRGEISGIILDLRENPGGLLDAAVNVTETFLPKNSLVVSTKGKIPSSAFMREYISQKDPLLSSTPLVVVMNKNSASASEIVAGAIQDYDRGVLVGTRTYGKGLVQNIVPLPYNTQLKLTTAKYYTPSGRCIQEIDYSKEEKGGVYVATPESLRKDFYTTHNRKVKDLGGVSPDTVVEFPESSSLYKALMQKSFLFKYANAFYSANKIMPLEFPNDSAMLSEFKKFVTEKQFSFEEETETTLKELIELANKSGMSATLLSQLEETQKQLALEKDSSFERSRIEILRTLRMEIMSRYRGEKGRIEESLKDDNQIAAAKEILRNKELYSHFLFPQTELHQVHKENKKE